MDMKFVTMGIKRASVLVLVLLSGNAMGVRARNRVANQAQPQIVPLVPMAEACVYAVAGALAPAVCAGAGRCAGVFLGGAVGASVAAATMLSEEHGTSGVALVGGVLYGAFEGAQWGEDCGLYAGLAAAAWLCCCKARRHFRQAINS